MEIICPRCQPMEVPQILVASRVNQLCDKCGNSLFNITERIDMQAAFEMSETDQEPEQEPVDTAEVFADVIIKKPGEVDADAVVDQPTEEASDAIANKMTLDADEDNVLDADEGIDLEPDLDKMSEKLRQLGKELDIGNYWNRHIDELKIEIQEALNQQQTG